MAEYMLRWHYYSHLLSILLFPSSAIQSSSSFVSSLPQPPSLPKNPITQNHQKIILSTKTTKAGCVKENQYGGWLRASPVRIPGRRRPEGRPDSSPVESSADRNSFGNTGDYGKDVHVPAKSGEVKKGRRQLQWESVTKDGENRVVGLGQTILSATEKELVEPNNFSHARSEPINPISVSQVEVINKAHSEGSSIGPMEVMKEDQFILENTTAHGVEKASPRRTKKIPSGVLDSEVVVQKEDASKTVHVSGTGQNKKAPIKGYKRIPKEVAISELDRQRVTGEGQAKSAKRKCDEVCENGELMQGTVQIQSKRRKEGKVQEVIVTNATVEVASREWPQVSK